MTKEERRSLIERIRQGRGLETSLRILGIERKKYVLYKKRNKGFEEEMEKAYEEATESLEDKAYELALKGSERMVLAVLRARRAQGWQEQGGGGMTEDYPQSLEEWLRRYKVGG